ncbi:RING finger protein, partial [Euroglyphus maynei]
WPCLHQWFETKPVRPTCPVCKNPISRDQVIPLYGRGSSKKDPREKKIPPRPQGQRSEQDYSSMGFPNFGFGDGFHMSFGIGAVPFGFFASTFNIGEFRGGPMMDGLDLAQDRFVSKLFMWIAIIFIFWLLFA